MSKEPETVAVTEHVLACVSLGGQVVISWLGETELRRAVARSGIEQAAAERLIDSLVVAELTHSVFEEAGRLGGRSLRTLDALHIAVARQLRAKCFVSYDERQCREAAEAGLNVLSP